MAKAKAAILKVPVAYGNVNCGDETARIGIKISRGNLTPSAADRQFCGKRITGTISAGPPGAQAENGVLPGHEGDLELTAVFDCKGFSTTSKHIGTGLTFALGSIDVTELVKFARREGMLSVEAVEALPEDEGDDEEKDDK